MKSNQLKIHYNPELHFSVQRVIDCCLTPIQQFSSYIMVSSY